MRPAIMMRTNHIFSEPVWAAGRTRKALAFGLAMISALLLLFGLQAANPAHAATTFIVNDTGDGADANLDDDPNVCADTAGKCTLRAAIQEANDTPGADTIEFAIPGTGPHTISPSSALPDITEVVTINGYSESLGEGSTPARENTLPVGNDAVLKIVLSGASIPTGSFESGLKIKASDSTVKGLVINKWDNGVFLDTVATGNTVRGNYIGTDVTGTVTNPDGIPFNGDELGNNIGVVALGDNNTIGGTTAAARNIISGNGSGVHIGSAMEGNKVQGNYIGTNAAGDTALGNTSGVVIFGSPNNTIGGTTATARNVISGNSVFGIRIGFTGATLNKVQGNYIGISAEGDTTLANGNDGVRIEADADNNTIGGTTAGAGNIISGNSGDGVEVDYQADPDGGGPAIGDPDAATGNRILSNSIYDNSGLGIDLIHSNDPPGVTANDDGDGDGGFGPPDPATAPNRLQNYPELTSAKPITKLIKGKRKRFTVIRGTLNSTPGQTFTVQFFSSPVADPSGFGEGKTFAGQLTDVTTDTNGDASFAIRVARSKAPVGSAITATATNNSTRDTSEFSAACSVGSPCPP